MSEIKHTPGPYLRKGALVYALDKTGTVNRMTALVQEGIAVFDPRRPVGSSTKATREEAEATAQLFAAAPELLEALDDLAEIVGACTFETIRMRGQYVDRKEAVARARASIAKAKGEGANG